MAVAVRRHTRRRKLRRLPGRKRLCRRRNRNRIDEGIGASRKRHRQASEQQCCQEQRTGACGPPELGAVFTANHLDHGKHSLRTESELIYPMALPSSGYSRRKKPPSMDVCERCYSDSTLLLSLIIRHSHSNRMSLQGGVLHPASRQSTKYALLFHILQCSTIHINSGSHFDGVSD